MQQQQQKYAAQQAGYDRMFALGRDQQQASRQAVMLGQQNAQQAIRDATQFANNQTLQESQNKFRQQQEEAQRQQQFMDEARKQSSGMIMEDIKNQNYDPATSRKLQQNLVAESEALGNPQLDATQRAEALAKIRAERAMLTANRMEKPPAPTAQEEFDQSIVTGADGTQYRRNSKGDFDPIEQQPKKPTTATEAFQADPKVRDKYMEEAKAIEVGEEALTPENRKKAMARAQQLWEEDNSPTEMPPLPGTSAPTTPGAERSILDQSPTAAPAMPGASSATQSAEQSILEISPDQQLGLEAAYDADMTSKGYRLVTPSDGGRPYYSNEPLPSQPAAPQAPTPAPAQNPWAEVAKPREQMPLTSNASSANAAQSSPAPAKVEVPNFTDLIYKTKDADERRVLTSLQGMYAKQPPEVQNAIGVILNEQSPLPDLKAANDYLRSVGIDIDQLATYQHRGGGRKGKNK